MRIGDVREEGGKEYKAIGLEIRKPEKGQKRGTNKEE